MKSERFQKVDVGLHRATFLTYTIRLSLLLNVIKLGWMALLCNSESWKFVIENKRIVEATEIKFPA